MRWVKSLFVEEQKLGVVVLLIRRYNGLKTKSNNKVPFITLCTTQLLSGMDPKKNLSLFHYREPASFTLLTFETTTITSSVNGVTFLGRRQSLLSQFDQNSSLLLLS